MPQYPLFEAVERESVMLDEAKELKPICPFDVADESSASIRDESTAAYPCAVFLVEMLVCATMFDVDDA